MKKYVVGNWKMNQDLASIKEFFVQLNAIKQPFSCESWIAPQFIHFSIVKDLAFTIGRIQVGAQNCSEKESGAFTGEVSAHALKDLGASFVIVGHSERRQILKEVDEVIKSKIELCWKENLPTILCVGETLQEREEGHTFSIIEQQLTNSLPAKLSPDLLLIAYEPVWAIRTGKNATSQQAREVHAFIREILFKKYGSNATPLLYGGSINPSNVEELLSQENIDGVLVGGSSLKAKDYASLCQIASQFN